MNSESKHKVPLNAWYVIAWAGEAVESLSARVICDIPVVFFRKADGSISVLEDACPHRLAPLSLGFIENDHVFCGYHGMKFNADGECVQMPGNNTGASIPASACVRAFPVVEQYGLIWIWPGQPELADTSNVPDLHWLNDEELTSTQDGYLHVKCDYRLVLDNLMDLTHETFLHPETVGQKELPHADFDVEVSVDEVLLTRYLVNIKAPQFFYDHFKLAINLSPDKVDRWQNIKFIMPSIVILDVGVAATGTGALDGDRTKAISGVGINAITPGAKGEAHYFYAYSRDYLREDSELTKRFAVGVAEVFKQDQVMLNAQQVNINQFKNQRIKNYSIDKGSRHVREIIDRVAHAECVF